jgi:hypothetical protein
MTKFWSTSFLVSVPTLLYITHRNAIFSPVCGSPILYHSIFSSLCVMKLKIPMWGHCTLYEVLVMKYVWHWNLVKHTGLHKSSQQPNNIQVFPVSKHRDIFENDYWQANFGSRLRLHTARHHGTLLLQK